MFDRLFGRGAKKTEPAPDILFGRYSDNNKTPAQVSRWADAENFFKEKKYPECLDAFFEYLRDDAVQNVVYERNGREGRFQLYQGSKIVRGGFDSHALKAEVSLASMPQPSVPLMRRLLEMNFSLYYSRYALDRERLCMCFDSDIETANPGKLYYGLKELATKADKQDDLLVQDFATLEATDNDHIIPIPDKEKEVKYEFMQQWIKKTLEVTDSLDGEKFSGGIAYLLLGLVYRIDYLIVPEGKLLQDLETIAGIYFKKDDKPVTEKNQLMAEEFRKLLAKDKSEVFPNLYRSKHTFSIVAPQAYKSVADAINASNQNMIWYRDNKYFFIAAQISEYGIAYSQYSYSLPRVITELYHLFMMINYSSYFEALGVGEKLYDPAGNRFAKSIIEEKIGNIQLRWKEKYPGMHFRTGNLRYGDLVEFNYSFTQELASLNMESK
jgi:hypothetical protein